MRPHERPRVSRERRGGFVTVSLNTGEEHFGEDEAEGLEEAAPKQRGVVHARFRSHTEKIPRTLRETYNIDAVARTAAAQRTACNRIRRLMQDVVAPWADCDL